MFETREMWQWNFEEEMIRVKSRVKEFPFVAFDTEFPGFTVRTPRYASEDKRYRHMRINVEGTKLIQLGFTLFNDRGMIGGTWEVNFSNFGEPSDTRNVEAMDFLKKHGLDLKRIRKEGIDMFQSSFFPKFFCMLSSEQNVQWVTFHGNYDFAYMISILNKGQRFPVVLPQTSDEFADVVGRVFGVVYDLKVIASAYTWLGEDLGLERMAQKLRVQRVGNAHHAGSDSLLTAMVFIKANQLRLDTEQARGFIYGIGKQVVNTRPTVSSEAMMLRQAGILSYASILCNRYPNHGLSQRFHICDPMH